MHNALNLACAKNVQRKSTPVGFKTGKKRLFSGTNGQLNQLIKSQPKDKYKKTLIKMTTFLRKLRIPPV